MPIRDLGFDASTNVSQNITSRKPGVLRKRYKTVTNPSICQCHCKEGDKFVTGGITSEKGNFTSKP
jgi:hypothetical protein